MKQVPATPEQTIAPADITGLLLAGGRGTRMGGINNANRNRAAYEAFDVPVWPDSVADYPGPLASLLSGLEHCATPWLLTVPCNTPLFPLDLAERLAKVAVTSNPEITMVSAPGLKDKADGDKAARAQPVFSLLRADLCDSLRRYIDGSRKVHAWAAQHRAVLAPFVRPGDASEAFLNVNTLTELHALEN
mgnify:CR=1 FL=1